MGLPLNYDIVFLYLPNADIFNPLAKRSLERHAKFERITSYFDDVVEQGAHCGHWKGRRKQRNVTKLNQHLQIIFICIFILQKNISQNYFETITEKKFLQ